MSKKLTIEQLRKKFSGLMISLKLGQEHSDTIDRELRDFLEFLADSVRKYKKDSMKYKMPPYLAHYTSINTIHSILKSRITMKKEEEKWLKKTNPEGILNNLEKEKIESKKSQIGLRLYAASEMNDPTEGTILKDEFKKSCPWILAAKDTPEAFICSFVSSKVKLDADNIADNITYWQAYGKDGLGCSIQPYISKNLRANLFPVLYKTIEEKTQEAATIREQFKTFFDYGEEIHQELEKLSSKHQKRFATDFWQCFNSIEFLYKHTGYIKETEYRYIAKSPDDKVLYDANLAGNDLIIRKYTTVPELSASNILSKGSKIYIGPRVHNSQTVRKYFEKLAKKGGLYDIQFELSNIPYRGRK